MTHKDIYTKFMIEYDKANVTSSYPSLTEYEVATILDKAYNALIAQKVTGNNVRRATFEADTKAISDLQPIVVKGKPITAYAIADTNILYGNLPDKYLYFVSANLVRTTVSENLTETTAYVYNGDVNGSSSYACTINVPNVDMYNNLVEGKTYSEDYIKSIYLYKSEYDSVPVGGWIDVMLNGDFDHGHKIFTLKKVKAMMSSKDASAYDKIKDRKMPVKLVSHDMAEKFMASSFNIPWIKIPVCYIEDNKIYVVYDSFKTPNITDGIQLTYIKKPNTFVKDLDSSVFSNATGVTYFDPGDGGADVAALYQFECNSTVAEELISLAIAFALENVESQRLNSKLNMRGLEA